ncbi:MAG: DUF4276 family protein [Chromatiaceae bacterium]|nr:DUF4276 family protein [Candidatus Thioaporhodococcus sediminis]
MPRFIAAFVEDFAHRQVIGALIRRLAAEIGLEIQIDWRNARRGHGQVVKEVKEYLRDIDRQGTLPDLIVIGTDANCKGLTERSRDIPVSDSQVPVVLAIPDPHVERWLLLDGAAFKAALGQGCRAPDQKCARDRYKEALIKAVMAAGVVPSLGGIEFADDILAAMDLERAARADPSLQRFLDDLRQALRREGP